MLAWACVGFPKFERIFESNKLFYFISHNSQILSGELYKKMFPFSEFIKDISMVVDSESVLLSGAGARWRYPQYDILAKCIWLVKYCLSAYIWWLVSILCTEDNIPQSQSADSSKPQKVTKLITN